MHVGHLIYLTNLLLTGLCYVTSATYNEKKVVFGDAALGPQEVKPQVLAFGGNGCIGSATVRRLLDVAAVGGTSYDITIVNRGNWYWHSATTVKPYVTHIVCDRQRPLADCPRFMEYLSQVKSIEAVIDFSACQSHQVKDAVSLLRRKAKLYIFISTDSVYEVCAYRAHGGPTRESDAVRPEGEEKAKRFAEGNDYGHRKLLCEEELARQRSGSGSGVPYITLRLPDVIGRGENTYRWWVYQVWIKLKKYISRPVPVPDFLLHRPMSMVYAEDVGKIISDIIREKMPRYQIIDQAFNLAFEENPTLTTLLRDISLELNMEDRPYEIVSGKSAAEDLPNIASALNGFMVKLGYGDTNQSAAYLYPSVHRGPVDITKARELLAFRPTSWKVAVAETVRFYEDAVREGAFAPLADLFKSIMKDVGNDKELFYRGLKEAYSFEMTRDEL